MAELKILMLACDSNSTRISYNRLHQMFGIQQVILENKVPVKQVLKSKIKKHGWIQAIGQIAFQMIIPKILARSSQERIKEIIQENQLKSNALPADKIIRVSSINDTATIAHIQQIQPDLIIVNGTRIISKKVIEASPCPMLNMHAGITPQYRGVHGGYWALWNKDPEHCGVTIHFVDAGVDTGQIIAQKVINISNKDNFTTYPLLQQAAGLQLLEKAIRDYQLNNTQVASENSRESHQWYHPTLWGYLHSRIFKKVK